MYFLRNKVNNLYLSIFVCLYIFHNISEIEYFSSTVLIKGFYVLRNVIFFDK
jgi:hypothetical protein